MQDRHFKVWPQGRPYTLSQPKTSIYENLAATARRIPDAPAILYYGTVLTYGALHAQVLRLAGYLASEAGVRADDRVLLYLQNSPQFVIGYYAVLAANAVVVPVNPMNRSGELRHMLADTEARAIIAGQELADQVTPLMPADGSVRLIVAAYGDYLGEAGDLDVPDAVLAPAEPVTAENAIAWRRAMALNYPPPAHARGPDDWCVIVYSSGTTGQPKGCLHSHATTGAVTQAYPNWNPMPPNAAILATLPLFHVTGMQNSMHVPILTGAPMVMMTRWNRDNAARLIQRHRVAQWRSITTMMIDFLAKPDIADYDLSSLISVGGGGAQMPAAVARKLKAMTGLDYVEGYGLTETMAPSHINPPQAARPQCLGIPIFDVDSRVVDPETLKELGPGEVGEILIAGPQVFVGYWRQPEATEAAFVRLDGKKFFRSGDLGSYDEDGYFTYADRLKRMINSSGFKVWPAEVEALMHGHPCIQEACVIAAPDPRRGETVKAVVVLRDGAQPLTAEDLELWCRDQMAAYKVPRLYEFAASLPRSGTGKVQWRELQARENAAAAQKSKVE